MQNRLGVIFIKRKQLIIFILAFVVVFLGMNYFKLSDNFLGNKKYVYVLGNVVGIRANTEGVLVLGYEDNIQYIDKLKEGDNILYINDEKVNSSQDVYDILNKLKKNIVNIKFERSGKILTKSVKTKNEDGIYKLGFWVRDKITGIGTMTCYDPEKNQFYAIGHPIYDIDTQQVLKIKEGNIYNISNLEIIKGQDNKIGQIKGNFDIKNIIGNFKNNSNYGIEGNLNQNSINTDNKKRFQVASFKDIKLGKATILFASKDNEVKSYNILIKNIDKKSKILEVEIVDKELINYTGGIIQGMSGAPIIQNDKLIGSITYVLKKNPKKGFGIFIGEMIK
ncbi:SpoIVB peptidase S55 domain-containing protein [Intestinibacter bartlettii]|uniref:SpoIVB peptidase S55 domain-containing protein n=1 Tax=Intestinibacter bartlettii TaxID=261299 RepID=UPI0024308981|nr:SpoIVB peptidase S55 domain-containing protein [Intestinibacter bartlettii]MDU6822654.1 SpoIVB peptidase S55 domain-containing protein [Intestinibacter bartlettii]